MTDTAALLVPSWLDGSVGDLLERGGHVVVGCFDPRHEWPAFVRHLAGLAPNVATLGLDPPLDEPGRSEHLAFPPWLGDGDATPAVTAVLSRDARGALGHLSGLAFLANAPLPLRPVDLVVAVGSVGAPSL